MNGRTEDSPRYLALAGVIIETEDIQMEITMVHTSNEMAKTRER